MPTTLSVRRTIAAPREQVFAVAADFPNAAQTVRAIQSVEMLTPGPVGPGTRFKETRVIFGRAASEVMTVREFVPPERYTLLAESHGCRYDSGLTFNVVPTGTEVVMTFVATPLTLPAKIMGFIFRGMTKQIVKECAKDLDDVAAAVLRKGA